MNSRKDSAAPTRLLFVCHGNICRSPMAEFIMKSLVRDDGTAFHIESAAVSTEEIGNPIYPPAQRCLRRHGIPFDPEKRARQVRRADYAAFDRILCMDASNLRLIRRIIPEDPEGKIGLLMACAGSARDVADPWYTGDFETAYEDILAGCQALRNTL